VGECSRMSPMRASGDGIEASVVSTRFCLAPESPSSSDRSSTKRSPATVAIAGGWDAGLVMEFFGCSAQTPRGKRFKVDR
jgi:hypothetical protein